MSQQPSVPGPLVPGTLASGDGQGNGTDVARMDAIDRMFAEFELVYHNQYHKAFATREKEEWAKKLWYSHLQGYSASAIVSATRQAVRESDFLPTVHGVLKYLQHQGPVLPVLNGLPAPDTSLSRSERQAALARLRKNTGV